MHPLQSFAATQFQVNPFEGINFSVEGDPPAVELAIDMVHCLGGKAFEISSSAKTQYHASAVMASNYLIALLDMACTLTGEAGLSEKESLNILILLIRGSLENA